MDASASRPALIGDLFRAQRGRRPRSAGRLARRAKSSPGASSTARQPHRARAARARRRQAATASSSGPTRSSRWCRSSPRREARRRVRAAERAARRREAAEVARLARPRLLVTDAARAAARARAGARGRASSARQAARPLSRSARPPTTTSTSPRSASATRTCCSSPAAARAARRASCSRTAPTGCAASRACSATSPAHGLHVPALPHGGVHAGARRLADARRDRLRALPDARGAARRGGATPRQPPLLHSAGVGAHARERTSARFDLSSLRELDTGTSAVPIELIRALKARFPGTRTRIYYGSTEAGSVATLPDADVLAKPGSRRARRARRRAAPRRGRRDLRAQPVPDGRLLRRRGGDARPRCAAAGTAPATSARSTRTAACPRRPHEGRDPQRRRERRRPRRWRPRSRGCGGVREVAVVGVPDPEWGERVCAVVVPEPGAAPTLEALQGALRGAHRRLQAPAAPRAGGRAPAHRGHRPGATRAARRTHRDRDLKEARWQQERKLGEVATKLLFENERVRVWEMRLGPGEEGAVHRHDLDYVLVQIEGDRMAVVPEPDSGGAFRSTSRPTFPRQRRVHRARRHREGEERRAGARIARS